MRTEAKIATSSAGATTLVVRLALLLAGLSAFSAFARTSSAEEQCVSGEYVLSGFSGLRLHREIKELRGLSPVALDIKEQNSAAVLIRERRSGRAESIVPRNQATLCDRLEKAWRRARQDGAATEKLMLLQRPTCSCNQVLRSNLTPNDNYSGLLWGLSQQNNIDIDAPEAWDISTGSSTTLVAVIDSGVDYNHPDLSPNIWTNPYEANGAPGVDDDGNGYIDDLHGINAITNSGDPMDDHGHGTHCSGTIGGVGNNGVGVTGVNWSVRIIGAKFLSASGSGYLFDAVKAINYVTDLKRRGFNIVLSNNSWGGGGYSQALYDAIQQARGAGILFVAAAGNSAQNTDVSSAYPAGYPISNVISVAAVDSSGNLASFSNYGAYSVDIAAPGVQILSTLPGNQYRYMSGTSMAAPHVSGALALLASTWSNLSADGLKELLLRNAVPLASLKDRVATGGMLNVYRMLLDAGSTPPGPTPTPTATPTLTPTPTPPPPTPTPSSTPTPVPTPGIYKLTGQITAGAGTGVSQVRLVLALESGPNLVRYSDPNGRYAFEEISGPVRYTLTVSRPGYRFTAPVTTGLLVSDRQLDFTAAAKLYLLTGRVVTVENEPFAGVLISGGPLGLTTTDANGRFTFQVVYGTDYTISALPLPGLHFSYNDLSGRMIGNIHRLMVGFVEYGAPDLDF